jgi:asparagine synthase (glutamine-hydrolysing)
MSRLLDSAKNDVPMSKADGIERLEQTLAQAVEIQTVADVPLGAFLSGGVDSSTIVALMQYRCTARIKTFTIGFDENGFDESPYARAVAKYLGTDHNEMRVSSSMAQDVIPSLPLIYDEPFGDSSQIPTALICALTRRHVTVCLSGDGADEVFGGYNRYIMGAYYWKTFQPIPLIIKKAVAKFALSISANTLNSILARMNPYLPTTIRLSNPGEMLHKLASIMDAPSADIVYRRLVSQCDEKTKPTNTITPNAFLDDSRRWPQLPHFAERMMALDSLTYLPDDILVKVDRASMAASLETRAPYLNERVIEFAWQLPMHQKIRAGQGKWLLRQVLDRYVPKQFIDRPKQGFGIPLADWLRGPLRGWAEDLLSPSKLSSDGFLNPVRVQTMWKEHLKGRNYQHAVWNILMYQAWRSRWA